MFFACQVWDRSKTLALDARQSGGRYVGEGRRIIAEALSQRASTHDADLEGILENVKARLDHGPCRPYYPGAGDGLFGRKANDDNERLRSIDLASSGIAGKTDAQCCQRDHFRAIAC